MSSVAVAPVLRVSIDSMRHTMLQMLDARHDDLVACVNAGVDAAIATLPAEIAAQARGMSQSIIEESLRKALEAYWNSGAGRAQLDKMIAAKFK